MSKYKDIVDQIIKQIKEDGGGAGGAAGGANTGAPSGMSTGAIGSTTAHDGNTSIDYIPGGLSKKKKAKLTGVKKVREDNDEDEEESEPEDAVLEQRSELIHNIYNKLMRVMTVDLRDNKQIKRTIVLLNYWLSLFPQSKYLPISVPVAVNLGSYDKSILELINRIKNIYVDDMGGLQELVTAIKEDRPLNALAPFSECDYIVGVRVETKYQGIVMVLNITVNLAMIPTCSLYVESSDVLDELESYRTVKVLKDMAFPVGQFFSPSIFHNIKDIIDDLNG